MDLPRSVYSRDPTIAEMCAFDAGSATGEITLFELNHKRVLMMMREDNLLCVRRRAFAVTNAWGTSLPLRPSLARPTQ